jgi:hypothetical protein
VARRRSRRPHGLTLLFVIGPFVFGSLFYSMRQDVKAQLLQKRMTELDATQAQLARELGERGREIAARTDISRIIPRIESHGLVPPRDQQVLALTAPPVDRTTQRSMTVTVLDFLSGVHPLQAAQKTEPEPAAVPDDREGNR